MWSICQIAKRPTESWPTSVRKCRLPENWWENEKKLQYFSWSLQLIIQLCKKMKICHCSRTLFSGLSLTTSLTCWLIDPTGGVQLTTNQIVASIMRASKTHSYTADTGPSAVVCAATAIPSSYQLSSQVNSAQGHLRPKCRASALDLNCCNWKDFIAFGISNKITQLEIMTIHFMLHLINMRAEICRSVCVVVSKLSPGLF